MRFNKNADGDASAEEKEPPQRRVGLKIRAVLWGLREVRERGRIERHLQSGMSSLSGYIILKEQLEE